MFLSIKKFTILLLFPLAAFSQDASRAAYAAYFDSIVGPGDQLLYNGVQFADLYRSDRLDHRFLKSADYLKGDISYAGQDYFNINMKYDLVDDQVIVSSRGELNFMDVQLIKEKIKSFRIDNKNFVYYPAGEVLEAGFYEEAYKDENNVLLVKYTKNPREQFEDDQVNFTFRPGRSYFIKTESTTTNVDSPRDIKRLFTNRTVLQPNSSFGSLNEDEDFRLYLIRALENLNSNQ